MKIKWGAMVTEGRGKLGGHVASKGKGADVFFTKPRAVNRQTAYQSGQRAIFARLSREWSQLTAAQIRGWNDAVELFRYTNVFGDSRSLSGKALFQQLNTNLILSNQVTIQSAPGPTTTPSVLFSSVLVNSFGTPIWQGGVGGTGASYLVYATPVLSSGTSYVSDRLVLLGASVISAGGNVTIPNGWQLRFGSHEVGSNIYLAIRSVNAIGQTSPLNIMQASVT